MLNVFLVLWTYYGLMYKLLYFIVTAGYIYNDVANYCVLLKKRLQFIVEFTLNDDY